MEFKYDAIFGLVYTSKEYEYQWLIGYNRCLNLPLTEDLMENKTQIYSNY